MAVTVENGAQRSGFPWRLAGWAVPLVLLILPAVAMQFTPQVRWTVGDFIFAAIVFGLIGAIVELAVARSASWAYRGGVGLAVAAAFLHIWITGAVGIIGSENNPGNLLYLGVVAVAAFATIVVLGRAAGMAWAMAIAAVAEVLVPILAYAGIADPVSDVVAPEVFATGILFTGMWIVAAALFAKAARVTAAP